MWKERLGFGHAGLLVEAQFVRLKSMYEQHGSEDQCVTRWVEQENFSEQCCWAAKFEPRLPVDPAVRRLTGRFEEAGSTLACVRRAPQEFLFDRRQFKSLDRTNPMKVLPLSM